DPDRKCDQHEPETRPRNQANRDLIRDGEECENDSEKRREDQQPEPTVRNDGSQRNGSHANEATDCRLEMKKEAGCAGRMSGCASEKKPPVSTGGRTEPRPGRAAFRGSR